MTLLTKTEVYLNSKVDTKMFTIDIEITEDSTIKESSIKNTLREKLKIDTNLYYIIKEDVQVNTRMKSIKYSIELKNK